MKIEACEHRSCALPKLLLLIKMASTSAPEGMTELEVLEVGFKALQVLGVSRKEITEATLDVILAQFV